MELEGACLDDILFPLYEKLLSEGEGANGERGDLVELMGVTLRLTDPRARLSRSENRGKVFSALGELLWYLSGKNTLDFIEPYIDTYKNEAEDGLIYGGYGPRLISMNGHINQIKSTILTLKNASSTQSKRIVIQLFDADDIDKRHKDVPCTLNIQYLSRCGKLNSIVTMRSNDALFGLPHDIFCFTMLQEMIAVECGLELGSYIHFAASMHYYHDKKAQIVEYLSEGYQRIAPMPRMPEGAPFPIFETILKMEARLRSEAYSPLYDDLPPYWADISRLIEAFWIKGKNERLEKLEQDLTSEMYKPFVRSRRR